MEWLRFCIEWLCEAEGIIFLICTITTVMVAALTRPKRYVRNYKILAILLVVGISLFEYHDRAQPTLGEYFSVLLSYFSYGISFGLIFSFFYWSIVILMKVISIRMSITKVGKCIIVLASSIIIWYLAETWYNIGSLLVFFLAAFIEGLIK